MTFFNEKNVFSNDLHYDENINNTNDSKWKQKQKIIWFNAPFSKSVRTNIPKNYKMHKIFNSNTVKISYSCMKNISCMISSHNRNISNPIVKSYGCNYRVESKCPLNSECINPKLSTEPIFLIIKTATKVFALV